MIEANGEAVDRGTDADAEMFLRVDADARAIA
jgi:hypothetical protein